MGIRMESGHYPDSNNPDVLALPDGDDVLAQRILLDTKPPRRHKDASTKIARANYSRRFIDLFSIPGLYRAIITRFGAPTGRRTRDGFPFDTRNLDMFQVAIWLHDHGLATGQNSVQGLEAWAVRARLLQEARADNGDWSQYPRNISEVVTSPDEHLDNLRTSFAYPPRVPSANVRSWLTASEQFVDANRRTAGLDILVAGVSPADEQTDDEMPGDEEVPAPEGGPSGS
jgi:hypothetical protein